MLYTISILKALLIFSSPLSVVGGEINRRLSDDSDVPEVPSGPHQGCLLLLQENHDPQEKLVGVSFEQQNMSTSSSSYAVANELGATAATCDSNGMAGGYECNSVDLLSMLDLSELNAALPGGSTDNANDIWGWTDSFSAREFAIIGMKSGTAFVEITDTANPIYLGGLPTHTSSSSWRDIKTYNDYAIIGSEASGHGLQIFDLTQLLTASPSTQFTSTAHYDGVSNSHNVFVNENTGFAYAVGAGSAGTVNGCNGGLHVVNMNNPTSPSFAGCFLNDGYTHDVQCVVYNGPDSVYSGKEICFASNEDTITVVDVTDKNNMVQLDRRTYTGEDYTHQGWLTDDHSYFIYNDELDEVNGITSKTRTHVMDVRELTNIQYLGYHDGRTAAIDHNLYVKGDLVFQANYRAGLNVLKMTDISSSEFEEVGYFDVYAGSNSANFNGAWSNYPFFPSGTIVVSGIEQGLFVLKYTGDQGTPSPTPVNQPTEPPAPATSAPTTPLPTSCSGSEVIVTVVTDNYPGETSWELLNECTTTPTVELSGGGYTETLTTYSKSKCIQGPAGKYTFRIDDTYGDGICCGYGSGSYTVTVDGVQLADGGVFGSEESKSFGSCGLDPTPNPTEAPSKAPTKVPTKTPTKAPTISPTDSPTKTPTVPPTLNPTKAPTISPTDSPTKAPTSLPPTKVPTDNCISFQMDITTDAHPEEITWSVTKGCFEEVVFSGGPYIDANTEHTESACLPPGPYTFRINDSYGDGICCRSGNGKYSVSFGGEVIADNEGRFGHEQTFQLGEASANTFELNLTTDSYPRETSWQLFNRCTGKTEMLVPPGYYRETSDFTVTKCIPEGAYTFTIYDSQGDGIGEGNGSYSVKYGGQTKSDSSSSFNGYSDSVNWGSGTCDDTIKSEN